jgi:hypothetical protein
MKVYLILFSLSILFLDTIGSAAETQRLMASDAELAMTEEDPRFLQHIYDKVWIQIALEIDEFSLRDFQKALYFLKEFFGYFSREQNRSMFDAILLRLRRGDYLEAVGGISFVPALFGPQGEKHCCTITDLAEFLLEQEDWQWREDGVLFFREIVSTLNKITKGLIVDDGLTEHCIERKHDEIFELDDIFGENSVWDYFLERFPEEQIEEFVVRVPLLEFIWKRIHTSRRPFWMKKKREWLKIGCQPWDLKV